MPLINLLLFIISISPVVASEIAPLEDNILLAFERCQTLSVDLKKKQMNTADAPAFDMHCVNTPKGSLDFKCDYIDVKTNKKMHLELFTGGKSGFKVNLMSKGGTILKFVLGNQNAYYDTALTDNEHIQGRKVCAGIFLLEKDAIKKKG